MDFPFEAESIDTYWRWHGGSYKWVINIAILNNESDIWWISARHRTFWNNNESIWSYFIQFFTFLSELITIVSLPEHPYPFFKFLLIDSLINVLINLIMPNDTFDFIDLSLVKFANIVQKLFVLGCIYVGNQNILFLYLTVQVFIFGFVLLSDDPIKGFLIEVQIILLVHYRVCKYIHNGERFFQKIHLHKLSFAVQL